LRTRRDLLLDHDKTVSRSASQMHRGNPFAIVLGIVFLPWSLWSLALRGNPLAAPRGRTL